jgi:pimeloyl-ACP methyl ester carboxylesterase
MVDFIERTVEVNGTQLSVLEGGEGPPLLVLHDELGHPGWLAWHNQLAQRRRLIIPIQPGFRSERVRWMRSVRDLACFYGFLLRQPGLEAREVIGFSFGGWVAAEMAVGNPTLFDKMILVAPFGVKPREGFIMDMFPTTSAAYLRASVHDPEATPEFDALYGDASAQQYEDWEDARTEIARLGWEPYMHNLSLEPLLGGLNGVSTLVLWGDKDAILPESAVRTYEQRIPDARLKVFSGVGHRPEVEATAKFLKEVDSFLS